MVLAPGRRWNGRTRLRISIIAREASPLGWGRNYARVVQVVVLMAISQRRAEYPRSTVAAQLAVVHTRYTSILRWRPCVGVLRCWLRWWLKPTQTPSL